MPDRRSSSSVISRLQNWNRSTYSRFVLILVLFLLASVVLAIPLAAQTVTDLYAFTGGADGFGPYIPIAGPDGSLYGTTQLGGDLSCPGGFGYGCGTVYRLAPSGDTWSFSSLYNFEGQNDGLGYSTLALDRSGKLYGTTFGGTPWGAVFRLTPRPNGQLWHFDLLYQFKGQGDGGNPLSPVVVDKSGAIYGASQYGDLKGKGCDQQYGCGAIFRLSQKNGVWTEQTLYQFKGESDGGNPSTMIMDSTGAIYGTTASGGVFNSSCSLGCGVVFQLLWVNGKWEYKVLHAFHGPQQSPFGLVNDASGNLYGIVTLATFPGAAIFELSPPVGTGNWTLSYIHRYKGYPASYLTIGPKGVLYGDIYGDQDLNWGYIFQFVPPAQLGSPWMYTILVNFNKAPYSFYQNPSGVVVGLHGYLYATLSGGTYYPGNILSIAP